MVPYLRICIVSWGIDLKFLNIWRSWQLSSLVTVETSNPDCNTQCSQIFGSFLLNVTITVLFPIHLQVVGHALGICLAIGLPQIVYPTLLLSDQCCALMNHSPTIHSMLILRSRITPLLPLFWQTNGIMSMPHLCSQGAIAVTEPWYWSFWDNCSCSYLVDLLYSHSLPFAFEGLPGVLLVQLFCGVSDGSYDVVVGLPSLTRLTWIWGFFLLILNAVIAAGFWMICFEFLITVTVNLDLLTAVLCPSFFLLLLKWF